MSFSYLADKVRAADFTDYPFRHVQINHFFSEQHFAALTAAPEVNLTGLNSTEQLFDALFENGYKIIDFPGCITDKNEYIKWHRNKAVVRDKTNTSCEGYGITLRLMSAKTPLVEELTMYLKSPEFLGVLAGKFAIASDGVSSDNGLQKYLDGYEISPHPDIRKKALTYMVNLNPGADAEERDHHTHYLQFRDEYKYVESFWNGNPSKDRCWVPWDWCETKKMQRENNSIVIFSPNNQTIHGVKANYNHLVSQRTQLYGNLWYHENTTDSTPSWENLEIGRPERLEPTGKSTLKTLTRSAIPKPMRDMLKSLASRNGKGNEADEVISDRLKHKN